MSHIPIVVVIMSTFPLLATASIWSWKRDHTSYVGRLLLFGLLSCILWGLGLGLLLGFGASPVARILWLPSVTATAASIFLLTKVANSPTWRPPRALLAVIAAETLTIGVLTLTNDHHQIVAEDLNTSHFKFSIGFGIHTLLCFALLGLAAMEMSRRTADPSRMMRRFATMIMLLVISTFTVQVLQIPISQAFAAIALSAAAVAVHRGGLGYRDPDLAGFDPTDPVTGALSRRAIESVLSTMSPLVASRHHVMVIDVDRFKGVNDNFGHLAGDDVLAEITRRLSNAAPQLQLGRFGGDEFIGILPDTSPAEAEAIAVLAADSISSQPVTLADGRLVAVSVSIGTSSCADGDWRAWVARADAAMYLRKNPDRDDPSRVERRL